MEQILLIIIAACFISIMYYTGKTNELNDKIQRKDAIIKLYENKVREYEAKIREQDREIHELWKERIQNQTNKQQP